MRHVVKILNANYLRDGLSLGQLFGGNVAQADVADESLTLELGKHGQRFLNRSLRWFCESTHAKIYDVKNVEAQILQVVVNCVDEVLAGQSRNPGFVCATTSANFRDDNEIVGVGMQRASRIN